MGLRPGLTNSVSCSAAILRWGYVLAPIQNPVAAPVIEKP